MKPTLNKAVNFLFLVFTFYCAPAQNFHMVKDINLDTNSSNPSHLTANDNNLIFAAKNDSIGNELWKTDGTEQGTKLIKDIEKGYMDGIDSYYPSVPFFKSGNKIYFVGQTQNYGAELWETSGDSLSTTIVRDLSPGSSSSQFFFYFPRTFHWIADVNNRLYLTGSPASFIINYNLFTTNGTDELKGLDTSSPYSINNLTPFNNKLFYIKNSPQQLWITDSISNDKRQITTARPDNRNSLFTYKNILYYGSADGYMWRTDGTENNTKLFKKVRPDPYYNFNYTDLINDINAGTVDANAVLNGILYFAAFDSTHGSELWKTDGTTNGTVLVKDINNGIGDAQLGSFVVISNVLYFFANDGIHGRELWKTDGTTNGTVLVKDITPGSASSEILSVTQVQNKIVFLLYNGTNKSYKLWQSDATKDVTKEVDDISLNDLQIAPPLRVINNQIYFAARSIRYGNELWVGTLDGVLAVHLLSFTGKLLNDNAELNWTTINEQNFSYFNLQRSIDDIHFSTIAKINASSIQSLQKSYQYIDNNIIDFKSENIYYRLEEVDKDGKSTLSNIILIRLKEKGIYITAQPNPIKSDFKIQIDNARSEQQAQLQIINSNGSIILNEKINIAAGNSVLNYKASSWTDGVYVVRVILTDGTKKEMKIVKQ